MSAPRRRTAHDYQFGTRIGEGSYSTVFLAVDIYDSKTYAIKVLSKKHIVKEDKIKYVNIEKTTLHRLGQQHPGIVQLYYTFQDELLLFFVLDFAEYGELLSIIAKFGLLCESVSRFYMLQIIDAVLFIHLKGVIHRDLKPENILVGYDFNLKITDFGAAKLIGDDDDSQDETINYDGVSEKPLDSERRGSFVGTAEYVPPELLSQNVCGFETDMWAMGCILYQLFNGVPPFKGTTEYLTFEKIVAVEYSYRNAVPPSVKEIIDQILVLEPQSRLTIPQLQAKAWFRGVPWQDRDFIWNRKVPRFEPYVAPGSVPSALPQMKTGANRNFQKSSSNYQLHSQIQLGDFMVPTVGKKTYMPATRIKMARGFDVPPSPPRGQWRAPQPNLQAPVPIQSAQIPQQGNHLLNQPQTQKMPNMQQQQHLSAPMQNKQLPIQQHQLNKPFQPSPQISPKVLAQSQSGQTSIAPLEKNMAATQISGSPVSPGRSPHNLRNNTAFQKTKVGGTAPNTAPPLAPPPKIANAAARSASKISPPSSSQVRPSTPKETRPVTPKLARPVTPKQARAVSPKQTTPTSTRAARPAKSKDTKPLTNGVASSNVVTFKEISSFLEPTEKIIKLDTILKLLLSNRVINRKPGSLDDDMIEMLVDRHQTVLDRNMVPVVACVSNKARVFLIDSSLEVMMVDLTANKGGDYLMYDYEFESIVVDENDSPEGEEVFGYLILELIKEGGDLIFLKRLDEADKVKFKNPTRAVDKDGEVVRLGAKFGWIDCLIWAKEMVDKDVAKPAPKKTALAKKPVAAKKPALKPAQKPTLKPAPKPVLLAPQQQDSGKTELNKFAYAAAAAAHR